MLIRLWPYINMYPFKWKAIIKIFVLFFLFKVWISYILLCIHPFPFTVWQEFPAVSPSWSLTSWQWRDWAGRTHLRLWRWSDPVLAPTWVSSDSSRSLRPLKQIRWVQRPERRDTDTLPLRLSTVYILPLQFREWLQMEYKDNPFNDEADIRDLLARSLTINGEEVKKQASTPPGGVWSHLSMRCFSTQPRGSHQRVTRQHFGPIWNLALETGCLSQVD